MTLRDWPVAVLLAVLMTGCGRSGAPDSTQDRLAVSSESSQADTASLQWISVIGPDSSVMRAAVLRPRGTGPFPAVIILHGTHGFAEEYVKLARDIAAHGVLGVAACWFSGGRGAGTRFIRRIECPHAPALPDDSARDRFHLARPSIAALVRAVKSLPDVDSSRVALWGQSRGGGAALNYVISGTGTASALVLNSTGYPPEVESSAHNLNAPVLILHGTADAPADGGSPRSAIERARAFEAALRRSGKHVEVKYYEGARHNQIFTDSVQYRDAVERTAAFILASPR